MASVKDALEESLSERFAFIKYFIYAIPVFISYILFHKGNMVMFYMIAPLTFLMLATILIIAIRNVGTGNNYVLPTFNIIEFIISAIKAILALGPIFAISIIAGIMLCNINIPVAIPNIQLIYTIIVWVILGSIMLTSLIVYSKEERILDAYNFILISNSCMDILIAIIFFIPQLVIVNGLLLGTIAYLFWVFFTLENPVFIYICSMALVMNIVITGHYLAQMDYENIARAKN